MEWNLIKKKLIQRFPEIFYNIIPARNYLLKLVIETLEQSV